jgi:TolB-like protein
LTEIDLTNDQRWFKDGMTEDDIDQLKLGEEHH